MSWMFFLEDTTDESIEDDHLASKALSENPLFAWAPAHGDCQVMCFHPDSNKTLALMSPAEVRRVIDAWCDLTTKYQSQRRYRWLQIFENRGAAVGCSNMHPHCQLFKDVYGLDLVSHEGSSLRFRLV
ncbi:galactose-1-phosphate uridyl transferase protein [Opisthorchis viverrini]|uniref:UDP-glucose--hexose-1-phosphate uridylyltransferase n=1 Tax=Opisthorchis viverrini TaxID=6198 RepID=A0A1S8X6U9_OPIVI|nr:galactose-1-phosphate uridyl transferase protein [Opisthorchis viverrini]